MILVTGADGFIGSHFVDLLLKKKLKVRALVNYNSLSDYGWLNDNKYLNNKFIEIVSGDIRDQNFCNNLTKGINKVFHFAALIAIPHSYNSTESYIDTNIKGTFNICNAAKLSNVNKFFHISTSEVYGSALYTPIDENHPFQAQSPYSATKISADALALSFFYSYNFPLTVLRLFNTYGPRQSARAIIPTIITQLLKNSKGISLGNIKAIRDFNYVNDQCKIIYDLSNHRKLFGQTINIGSGLGISIESLLNKIFKISKKKRNIIKSKERLRPSNSEVSELICDNSKLKKIIKNPKFTSLDKGLNQTFTWFQNSKNIEKYKYNQYIT